MTKSKEKILLALRILMSVLFLFSAYSKLHSTESIGLVEHDINRLGILSLYNAQFLSRIVISLEILIGIAFLEGSFLKKITIPGTVLMLIVFCIHLSITGAKYGLNNGNCGCFGDLLPMSPLQAILKNLATIALLGFMWFSIKIDKRKKILPLSLVAIGALLFMFFAFPLKEFKIPVEPPKNETLATSDTKFGQFNAELDNGTQLIALYHLGNKQSKEAYQNIRSEIEPLDGVSMHVLGVGSKSDGESFMGKSHSESSINLIDIEEFKKLMDGAGFPRYFLVNEGKEIQIWNKEEFSIDALKEKLEEIE